ncbi:lipoprotein [Campylobacter upsaliensis]|nr:lipoprotein [Campylobacter upsaliensis]MCR2104875.1 lipoprotein [Campylobacter upsaliensis]MCR2110924.1 lipoprotein [Campylobacter upsaliensis]
MKKTLLAILSTLILSACASKDTEIPRKSPCACNYDIIKVG